MKYTKEELIKWHNFKTETYSINPKTNRKIKNHGPTYKKLKEEYNILIKEIDDIEENIKALNININENVNNIENKFVLYLELKDTRKIKIYEYKILNIKEYINGCSCNQKIEIKLNEKTEIKEDILNILDIIKKEYNNKKIQDFYGLNYICKIEELDIDGNVYGFIFESKDNNIEIPIIPVHCYSYVKKRTTNICMHIQYLSFYNYYNNESYDHETHLLIRY
jgi:hypothetical protein